MPGLDQEAENEVVNSIQFVKVSTTHNGAESNIQSSGYLTALSCKMLIVQLWQDGFELRRR